MLSYITPFSSLVGGLVFAALRERWRHRGASSWAAGIGALVITGLVGWGDEGIQALLPNRVYDLRDAVLNLVGGALIVLSLVGLELARRADSR